MKRVRIIPTLLLRNRKLVKTVRFKNPRYVGDPINAVRIFNDKEVDEIAIIQIDANRYDVGPDFEHLQEIASEAFMPLAFGGGILDEAAAERAFAAGAEKVILNAAAYENPGLITTLSNRYGAQSVVVSLDVGKSFWGGMWPCTRSATKMIKVTPVAAAKRFEELGAGEILLHDATREGTRTGMNLPLITQVAAAVSIPVIALGGARSVDDLGEAVRVGHAAAAAAGSLFVFHGPHEAVLVQYPSQAVLEEKVFLHD